MEFVRKYFKYIMVFLTAIMIIVLLVIMAADKDDEDSAGISGGVDIAVMPTKEAETDSKSEETGIQAIVIGIDTSKLNMVLQEVGTDTKITYSYTGGTEVLNRFDDVTSVNQLKVGEIVDVEFATNKRLSRIKISSKDWEYKNATGFSIDAEEKSLKIGNNKYYYNDNTVIANGNNIISIDELESIDVVTLRGKDKQIDSIIVTKGHGYVRLDNTTFFEGGFVEIGNDIVELITKNMVIPAPVGEYKITVTKTDTSGSKDIKVSVNEEIRVNLIEFQSDAVKLGTLSFKIEPKGAALMIDGVKQDYSELVDVSYGTHKIVVTADGYEPYSKVITVEDILKEYEIKLMEKETEETKDTEKETSTEEKSTTKEKETTTRQTIDFNSLVDDLLR